MAEKFGRDVAWNAVVFKVRRGHCTAALNDAIPLARALVPQRFTPFVVRPPIQERIRADYYDVADGYVTIVRCRAGPLPFP